VADNSVSNPASVLSDAARFGDVRTRLLFLIGGLIVYRIGTYIPVPGIDPERVASFFKDNAETIFGIVNMFSGGALERLSIFTMGVMPYISASIIVQMMAMVVPTWMEYRKEGESGRRRKRLSNKKVKFRGALTKKELQHPINQEKIKPHHE
jgi:preprotein translocase subunit SecY